METIKTPDAVRRAKPTFELKRLYVVPEMTGGKPDPSAGDGYYGKRLIDISIALLLTLILLPWLTPILFVLIKLDSRGPLFFRQKRAGRNGDIFYCIKFRTMYPNAKSNLLQASDNDARITPVGKFLRRFHIDELPQLINVLKGEMSLVGPRPHMLADEALFASLIPRYSKRQRLRPGLTGLAQIKGYHGPTPDYHSIYCRTRLDHFYISKVSVLLDIKIIIATVLIPFRK